MVDDNILNSNNFDYYISQLSELVMSKIAATAMIAILKKLLNHII